jgi:mannosyltransferase OCH1-like enzyme
MLEIPLPKFRNPIDKHLISNRYQIKKHPHKDDFNIIIYYINQNECEIIVRRLDDDNPWGQNLQLILYDVNQLSFEIVDIGSSDQNFKIFNYKTFIDLEIFNPSENNIPKIIVQTNDLNNYENLQHFNAIQSLLELNPNYNYFYFNGIDRREYIKNNMDSKILTTYDKIVSKTFKADFFRYIYLYLNGGCYFDHKFLLKKSIDKFIKTDFNNVLCRDIGEHKLQNGIIMAKPKEQFLLNMIEQICIHVDKKFYGIGPLEPTGPLLLFKKAHHQNVYLRFTYGSPTKNYKEETIIVHSTNEIIGHRYYNQYYQKRKYEEYGKLWQARLIYSHSIHEINDTYKIIVKPNSFEIVEKLPLKKEYKLKKTNNYHSNLTKSHGWHIINDTFSFELIDNELITTRTDQSFGWGQDLKIILLNVITSNSREINIGPSNHFIKKQLIHFI